MCVKRTAKDDDQDIVCPKCGTYLGPKQPLPHSLTRCIKCKLWVKMKTKNRGTVGHRGGSRVLLRTKLIAKLASPDFCLGMNEKICSFKFLTRRGKR